MGWSSILIILHFLRLVESSISLLDEQISSGSLVSLHPIPRERGLSKFVRFSLIDVFFLVS